MSNAKVISIIDHETRRVQAEDNAARSALATDLYAALEPLRAEVAQLRIDVDRLMRRD